MPGKIVVVGSSNTDMIIQSERIPRPGETVLGGRFAMAAGGKGANQAVAAARAGGQITFVARVGEDLFGENAILGFERDGIDVRHVHKTAGEASGVALIMVDQRGENSIAVAPGANARLTPEDVDGAETAIAESACVLAQLEVPLETAQRAMELAARHGVRAILNPAPARELPEALLRVVSVLTPNETEAELLTGLPARDEAEAAAAAERLAERGPRTVLITLGAKGVYARDPEWQGMVPGFPVEAVDTTAAGDVFNGALATALSEGKSLRDAIRFGCAAAAISVTRLGAQPSAPTRAEIEAFLAARGGL
ncbi:MAG TPA: ribokinase [Candidatus Hydrogenedentes bacterium]|nr:ribokinase [Candidatus Hydrogenedentota bacterium]